ncbi:P-loop containing nucleoside triphosphate hydrolase protein [Xylariales sp. PMI_506]|nr:P-loop containing nucleoside triphosphate hydrolase protein [Xylariales sp. PMI_506]
MGGAPSKPDPSKEMQVIGAAYGRTGTVSLSIALEKLLDGPVVHGGQRSFGGEGSYFEKWTDALEANQSGDRERGMKLIRELTSGYVGCTDSPHNLCVPELMELYPDAKVVLIKRDPQRWWASFQELVSHVLPWYVTPLTYPVPGLRAIPRFLAVWDKQRSEMYQQVTGKVPESYGPELLEYHNQMITSLVPRDNLLIMDLKDGWGPLCKFLGKPVPNEPFPQANDVEAMKGTAQKLLIKALLIWLGILGAAGGSCYIAYSGLSRYLSGS